MRAWTTAGAAAFAGILIATSSHAADRASQQIPPADACVKNVAALGASMSHKAETGADGKPVYRFVLRQNGFDYDVVCDAASGVVGDVSPRRHP